MQGERRAQRFGQQAEPVERRQGAHQHDGFGMRGGDVAQNALHVALERAVRAHLHRVVGSETDDDEIGRLVEAAREVVADHIARSGAVAPARPPVHGAAGALGELCGQMAGQGFGGVVDAHADRHRVAEHEQADGVGAATPLPRRGRLGQQGHDSTQSHRLGQKDGRERECHGTAESSAAQRSGRGGHSRESRSLNPAQ